MLTHKRNMRITPAIKAADTKVMVRGNTNWSAEVIFKTCTTLEARGWSNTFSGEMSMPRKGNTALKLIISAEALTSIRANNNQNCR